MQPRPLGNVVDEANRIQEEHAELAKLIVYVHEFELNKPRQEIDGPWSHVVPDNLAEHDGKPIQPRGFRLNEYGVDHVKRIAKYLLANAEQPVIVERSETSKHWDTVYHYPVHGNEYLDEQRRQVVVAGLEALGVQRADELVIVAPAYPQGQYSQEAVTGYRSLWNGSSAGSGSGMSTLGGSF